MAFTDAEEARIQDIEEMINALQIAYSNLASKTQLNQLILIKQREIDNLTARVETLESQLTVLQNRLT